MDRNGKMYTKASHTHFLLVSPVAAQLFIQPSSCRSPLRSQSAYASLHEAEGLLPSADLLQQGPDVRLENSLEETDVHMITYFLI